jgi:hypothetical protein
MARMPFQIRRVFAIKSFHLPIFLFKKNSMAAGNKGKVPALVKVNIIAM